MNPDYRDLFVEFNVQRVEFLIVGAYALAVHGHLREEPSISTVLARELRDLVSVHSEWLSREVPGFAAALAWPEGPVVPARPAGSGPAGPAAGPSPLGAFPQPVCAPMRDDTTIH